MGFDKFAFFKTMQYSPHSGQVELHKNNARFRILACGARWGKTTAAANEICAAMLDEPGIYWCVGPIYSIANVIFNQVRFNWLNNRPDFVEKYSETERYIRLINGAECYGKTADNPASLLAVGVTGMVLDEPALMKEEVWQEFLQSRLNDTQGWALFTGTPKGKGWYWHLYKRGREQNQDVYWSMDGPTWQNPKIDKEWLLAQRTNYSEKGWQQEVLGQFIDDQGAVFKAVRGNNRIRGTWNSETCVIEEPMANKTYALGADLAKHQDWTVITVLDADGHVCYWERLPHGMDWPSQRVRISAISQKYNRATCYVDSSGIGDPTLDDLKKERVPVIGVPTAQEKTQLIDALVIAFENNSITYPEIPILVNELEVFEHEKTGTGRDRYSAPRGFHDDAVISLALAWRGIGKKKVTVFMAGLYMAGERRLTLLEQRDLEFQAALYGR